MFKFFLAFIGLFRVSPKKGKECTQIRSVENMSAPLIFSFLKKKIEIQEGYKNIWCLGFLIDISASCSLALSSVREEKSIQSKI